LLFLATVSAHDLGYVGSLEFLERQELTFATLAKLGKFHGHFFNWYDTKTLQPLTPQYISTVDSGNLAAISLRSNKHASRCPIQSSLTVEQFWGLADTVDVVSAEARSWAN